MYIFTWEVEDGYHFCETVVHYENVVKLAKVFERAGYNFRVSSGITEHRQEEFGICNFNHWCDPGVKFTDEA